MINWTPVLNGDIYCSPACGRGCTLEEYDQAVKDADELAAQLGKAFQPHVWENLGWHYSATAAVPGEAFVTVNYSKRIGEYWANLHVTDKQEGAYAKDPEIAVARAINEMQEKVYRAVFELANLNMLLTQELTPMDEERKKWIVDNSDGCTLEGSPTTVAGWKTDIASLAPRFGGFWHTTWETAERVVTGDKKFYAKDVTFVSWQWLGVSDPVPDALKHYERW